MYFVTVWAKEIIGGCVPGHGNKFVLARLPEVDIHYFDRFEYLNSKKTGNGKCPAFLFSMPFADY